MKFDRGRSFLTKATKGIVLCAALLAFAPVARAEKGAADSKHEHKIKAPTTVEEHLSLIVEKYLEAHAGLSGDSMKDVGGLARDISKSSAWILEKTKAEKAEKGFTEAVTALGKSADALSNEKLNLEQAREKFKSLSAAVILLKEKYLPEAERKKTRRFTCPMAKADWLQKEDKAANPYMGSKMLKCGNEVKPDQKGTQHGGKEHRHMGH